MDSKLAFSVVSASNLFLSQNPYCLIILLFVAVCLLTLQTIINV